MSPSLLVRGIRCGGHKHVWHATSLAAVFVLLKARIRLNRRSHAWAADDVTRAEWAAVCGVGATRGLPWSAFHRQRACILVVPAYSPNANIDAERLTMNTLHVLQITTLVPLCLASSDQYQNASLSTILLHRWVTWLSDPPVKVRVGVARECMGALQ